MRLGGPVHVKYSDPGEWAEAVRNLGYRSTFCPVEVDAPEDEINAYARAAREADIVIAEVGAWSSPLSPEEATRKAALEQCKNALALAEAIGARCCVNIAGSRGTNWAGPCPDDLTDATFEMIVETVRSIIDSVRPTRTFYTLETMPWMYPDSTESYLNLIDAIDRPAFAVHFDAVNLINSPQRYFANGEVIRDFVGRLGTHIRSCHAKDILLQDRLTVHLNEVRPGCGGLDYPALLSELSKLDEDMPLIIEHLSSDEEYQAAAQYIRQVAETMHIPL